MKRLRDRVAELEREKEEVDAFAALAAHELMEPLVMIEVHASMLAAGDSGDAALDAAGIGRAAARLRRLVEAILLDVRAGREELAHRPVDLAHVLQDVLEMLAPEIEALAATVVVAGPMPTVPGDGALLTGLFTNLITNALKYGRREGATISVGVQQVGREWRLTVSDDGAPIPDTERVLIFQPFKRAQHERRARGAGLGLAICRRIVERHGGRIGMLSSESGNSFYFTLPA